MLKRKSFMIRKARGNVQLKTIIVSKAGYVFKGTSDRSFFCKQTLRVRDRHKYDYLILTKILSCNNSFSRAYCIFSYCVFEIYFLKIYQTTSDDIFVPINSKNKKISVKKSKLIWKALVESECIRPECIGQSEYGKVNTLEWIDQEPLRNLLQTYGYPTSLLKKLIYLLQDGVIKRTAITRKIFAQTFQQWLQCSDCYTQTECEIHLELGDKLWQILSTKNYIYHSDQTFITQCALFKGRFLSVIQVNNVTSVLPEIIHVLNFCADNQIGTSSCDVRSYDTDPNGNHKLFYVGMDRLQFNYKKNSNQVSSIESLDQTHRFEYDSLGNVTKAEHKQIEKIVYDEISNRAVKFVLKNGTQIHLAYDSMNERAYKCVLDNENKKVREIMYFRDNSGRCLVEKEITFNKQQEIENEYATAYVYGPKGLCGFIRDNEFYNVITDHEQSVRLVVKNMQIVAAYDYMPYVDTKEQYASPYKYAGNSPVCMYDPDGNFAVVVGLGFAVVGAYLGASASMDTWNPLEWEWSNMNLYYGLFFGALTGFFLPFVYCAGTVAISATFGVCLAAGEGITIALGIFGAYFGISSSMGSFNPCKWKWKKPALYNAAFQGFSSAVQMPNSISNFASVLGQFGALGKSVLIISSILSGGGMAYLTMASINNSYNPRNWQLNQRSIIGFMNGAFSGFFLPTSLLNIRSFFTPESLIKIKKKLIEQFGKFGHVLYYGTFALAAANPFLFLLALKQGMQCDWSKIKSCPAFLETFLSGIIVSISLPNLFFKAIPRTMKAYSDGIFETFFSKFEKVIENVIKKDQELLKEFVNETINDYTNEMSNVIKGEENAPKEGYQNAPGYVKNKVENYVNDSREQMKQHGSVLDSRSVYKDIFAYINMGAEIPDNLTAQDLQNNIENNPNLDQASKSNYTALVNDIKTSYEALIKKVMPSHELTKSANHQKNLLQINIMKEIFKKNSYQNLSEELKKEVTNYVNDFETNIRGDKDVKSPNDVYKQIFKEIKKTAQNQCSYDALKIYIEKHMKDNGMKQHYMDLVDYINSVFKSVLKKTNAAVY
ncbi:ion channel nompc, partial [Brachionus plicatilis]